MAGKRKIAQGIIKARTWLMIVLLVLAAWSATMIRETRINYDLNQYLAKDTMTQRALLVMNEEFDSSEQLRLMFSDRTQDELLSIQNTLTALEEVRLVSFNSDTDTKLAEGHTWQLITLTLNDCAPETFVVKLRNLFPEMGEYDVGGSAASQMDVQQSVADEIPKVMLIAVGIVLLVLLLTSRSWLDPLVILLPLGISILINMGTNFLFSDVSFITFAVCAILQLALSIDYAIMLLHTYNDYLDRGMKAQNAMTEALTDCFVRIASSAATTVAGLMALLFMSFTIGFDIGMVLSKGILISMLVVFFFMPGLILTMSKPLHLTRHHTLRLGGEYLATVIWKARKQIATILILTVFFGLYLNSQTSYSFYAADTLADSENARINDFFGSSNPLVLLVPGGTEDADYDLQRKLVNRLEAIQLGNGEAAVSKITAMVTTGSEALKYYTQQDVAEITGQPMAAVSLFFLMHRFGNRVRADHLLEAADSVAAGNERIASLRETLTTAKQAFEGPHYARMLLELNFQPGDEKYMTCMDTILSAASSVYGDDCYITGVPMSNYDIGKAFNGDLVKVNLITLLAILFVVTVSFRSFKLPLLLVFVIEGAIWITMGISHLASQSIFFISYLICLSIQMGATIDYGILLSDQYRQLRRREPCTVALRGALTKALPTVFTSGTILITAGYIIGSFCSVFYISSIGLLVSRGALVSMLLVLTLLPALLALFDRFNL